MSKAQGVALTGDGEIKSHVTQQCRPQASPNLMWEGKKVRVLQGEAWGEKAERRVKGILSSIYIWMPRIEFHHILFIHLFNKSLLSTYYVPWLSTGDMCQQNWSLFSHLILITSRDEGCCQVPAKSKKRAQRGCVTCLRSPARKW